MPGFRAATFNAKFQPRIPATYDGFASFENLTYPPRSVTLHAVGPDGVTDFEMAGYGDYAEVPLAMVREVTLYATDDPDNGTFVMGWLFTSQRVRYGLRKDAWLGAAIHFGGVPGSWPGIFDSFNRADTIGSFGVCGTGLGIADSGQTWDSNCCGISADRAAFGNGGDDGSIGSATLLTPMPLPCSIALDVIDLAANYGTATIRCGLSGGWEWILTMSAANLGSTAVDLSLNLNGNPVAGASNVVGTVPLYPVVHITPTGIAVAAFGLHLSAPGGNIWTQAGDLTIKGVSGGGGHVIFDNLMVTLG